MSIDSTRPPLPETASGDRAEKVLGHLDLDPHHGLHDPGARLAQGLARPPGRRRSRRPARRPLSGRRGSLPGWLRDSRIDSALSRGKPALGPTLRRRLGAPPGRLDRMETPARSEGATREGDAPWTGVGHGAQAQLHRRPRPLAARGRGRRPRAPRPSPRGPPDR